MSILPLTPIVVVRTVEWLKNLFDTVPRPSVFFIYKYPLLIRLYFFFLTFPIFIPLNLPLLHYTLLQTYLSYQQVLFPVYLLSCVYFFSLTMVVVLVSVRFPNSSFTNSLLNTYKNFKSTFYFTSLVTFIKIFFLYTQSTFLDFKFRQCTPILFDFF